jgi:hypothetical protein
MIDDDPFDLKRLTLPPDTIITRVVSRKIGKRREHFIQVPWRWLEALNGAGGQTYRMALILLYLHWKGRGAPIKLANGMLGMDGVPRTTKKRTLEDLECRGLISVAWRPRRTPVVSVLRARVTET